jgi:PAS domain S-box-containing protein
MLTIIKSEMSLIYIGLLYNKSAVTSGVRTSLDVIILALVITAIGGFLFYRFFNSRFWLSIMLTEVGELTIKLNGKTRNMKKLAHEFNGTIKRLSVYEDRTLVNLLEEKNRSVAIVNSISDPLFILDKNHRIVMANNACEQFFNFDVSKVRGRHFLEAIWEDELFGYISASMSSTQPVSKKVLHFDKDVDYYFNVIVTQSSDPDNQLNGCIVLMKNVTDYKDLERLKTEFVATVSHEFKTPLTSIIMGASMLEDKTLGTLSDEQMDVVKAIAEDGERLSGFVNELLEVSKLESEKADYTFEACSINAIVDNSVSRFINIAQKKNVLIFNNVDHNVPFVYADVERVSWVMNNLLNNALKYTKSGDQITISTKLEGNYIETAVHDTGDGIPPECLRRIFDEFVQVKEENIEVRGTGIGLAVAKDIITAHRGQISVESEIHAGTTFRFTLPLVNYKYMEE